MSKNVLIISSSPRKGGNSDLLCDEFAKGAAQSGNRVEKLFLRDYTIHYCTGCGYCVGNKGNCSQKDDMDIIKEKLIQAAVLVFATPIYFYTMAGQMKTFIDRLCYFYTLLPGKELYYIMTAADTDRSAMERALTEFGGLVACMENATEKGIIYGTGVWGKGEVKDKPVMRDAFEMGARV